MRVYSFLTDRSLSLACLWEYCLHFTSFIMGNTVTLRYPTSNTAQSPVYGEIVKYLIVFTACDKMTTVRIPYMTLEHCHLTMSGQKQTCLLCFKERIKGEKNLFPCVICKLAYYCDEDCMDNDHHRHLKYCEPNHMLVEPVNNHLVIVLMNLQPTLGCSSALYRSSWEIREFQPSHVTQLDG
jgi:hypothetical protein